MNSATHSSPLASADSLSRPSVAPARRDWITRVAGALWRALESTGRARAQPHLLAFADRCEAQQPALARELRAAARHGPLA